MSRSRSRTSLPRSAVETTLRPYSRSVSTISSATRSIASGSTGRFLHALRTPDISFSRSKGCFSPDRLATSSGAFSTRSKVVKRWLHTSHSRRRRMARPSSATRESTTRSSSWPQDGQRISEEILRYLRRISPIFRGFRKGAPQDVGAETAPDQTAGGTCLRPRRRPLREAEPVPRVVPEHRLDPIRPLGRLLQELDPSGRQLVVRRLAVVGLPDPSPDRAFGHQRPDLCTGLLVVHG